MLSFEPKLRKPKLRAFQCQAPHNSFLPTPKKFKSNHSLTFQLLSPLAFLQGFLGVLQGATLFLFLYVLLFS